MMRHIDVRTVLRECVCELYSNLVTRPTGEAVRAAIEFQLADVDGPTLTVIDFSNVGLLDFSCADEVVAKLLLRVASEWPHGERYFIFRGIRESHLEAIESALESYGLALVGETEDGVAKLIGTMDDAARQTWETVYRLGRAAPADVASALGADAGAAEAALRALHDRRLVMRVDDEYVPIGVTRE